MNEAPLVILQLTDLHFLPEPDQTMSGVNTEKTFKQVLLHALASHKKTDLIMLTGDLTQDPTLNCYQRIHHEMSKHPIKSICLPGNHDDYGMMQQVFNDEQLNCNKHVKIKDWQIISLNSKKPESHSGYLNADELHFLSGTLNQNKDLHTLIAVHHHPLPTQSQWMDTMTIENSAELFSILEKHPQVKAVICGHIHQELTLEKQGIMVWGAPSTCFQFTPLSKDYAVDEKEPGYRLLQLYPNGQISTQVYYLAEQKPD